MSKSIQAQVKATTPTKPSSAFVQSGLLSHTLVSPLNSHVVSSLDLSVTDSDTITLPHIGHDFSQIPVFSPHQPERIDSSMSQASPTGTTLIQRAPNNEQTSFTAIKDEDGENIGEHIRGARGNGSMLQANVRHRLEERMGVDLSPVRVHTGSEADQLAHSMQARAFTSGRDIFFAAGHYNPTSSSGVHLLTHEVVHTIQQASGRVSGTTIPGGISISHPLDSFEREAESLTDKALSPTTFEASVAEFQHSEGRPFGEDNNQTSRVTPGTAYMNHRSGGDSVQHAPHRSMQIGGDGIRSDTGVPVQREADTEPTPSIRHSRHRHALSGKKENKGEAPVKAAIRGLTQEQAQQDTRFRVSALLIANEGKVMARLTDWQEAARNVGSAYRKAYNLHKEALKKRAETDKLQINLAFLALSALTAGIFGWLGASYAVVAKGVEGGWAQSVFRTEELFNGLSTGIRQAATQGVNLERDAQKLAVELTLPNRPISEDPQDYQNSMENIVDDRRKAALLKFSDWHSLLATAPLSIYDWLDVNKMQDEIEAWISHSEQLAGFSNIGLDIEQMAFRIERSIWAKWIPGHLQMKVVDEYLSAEQVRTRKRPPATHMGLISPGRDLEDAFDRLLITQEAGVGSFSWWWTSEADIQKLIQWAQNYPLKKEDQFIKSGK